MKRTICMILSAVVLGMATFGSPAADVMIEDESYEQGLRSVTRERDDAARLDRARSMARMHRLSSMQVKEIASKLNDDNSRLDFALASFPRVVDPENFYEVYDAFRSFSKVMRLHDAIAPMRRHPSPQPVVVVPTIQPLSEKEAESIYKALKKEDFDNVRIQTARQIVTAGGKKFLSSQIKKMADCFDFENSKLEFAKYAYDYVLDPERYFLVNDALDFANSRQALSQHVESKLKKK